MNALPAQKVRLACLAMSLLAASSLARAEPGDHVRVGDATLIPKIDAGYEYHTNVAQLDTDPVPGSALRLAPAFTIESSTADVDWDMGFDYEARKYLNKDLQNFDRFTDFGFTTKLEVLKSQVVGLRVGDQAGYRSDPSTNLQGEQPFQSQFRNNLAGALLTRPGRVLEIAPGARWEFNDFLVPRIDGPLSINRRNTTGPTLSIQYNFFPKTALVADGEYVVNRWDNNALDTTGQQIPVATLNSPTLSMPDSKYYRLATGLRGRFTERVVLVSMLGYGVGNYLPGTGAGDSGSAIDANGLDGLLAIMQVRYKLEERHQVSAGYSKDFMDSYFTNYVSYHYLYLRMQNELGTRFHNQIEVGSRFEQYKGQVDRFDTVLSVREDFSYELRDYAALTMGVWWVQRASEDASVEYDDVNIHLMTTFTY